VYIEFKQNNFESRSCRRTSFISSSARTSIRQFSATDCNLRQQGMSLYWARMRAHSCIIYLFRSFGMFETYKHCYTEVKDGSQLTKI
jgi:hypothetical protein